MKTDGEGSFSAKAYSVAGVALTLAYWIATVLRELTSRPRAKASALPSMQAFADYFAQHEIAFGWLFIGLVLLAGPLLLALVVRTPALRLWIGLATLPFTAWTIYVIQSEAIANTDITRKVDIIGGVGLLLDCLFGVALLVVLLRRGLRAMGVNTY